jgi:DNA-3-methyladenine glycosylase
LGPEDKGAHSYGGRHNPRMDLLFKRGGFAYIYQLHGHNYCLNVVTQKEDLPPAVLIRAVEPLAGLELMAQRRGIDIRPDEINYIPPSKFKNPPNKLKNLTNGPSKLCQAMSVDTSLNGIDLCGNKLLYKEQEELKQDEEIMATPLINIDYAGEYRDWPWRFLIKAKCFC